MKKNILVVVGTRPNFIKVTQFKKCATQYVNLDFKIVHTGQHYDDKMADVFFRQFNLYPDYFLNISKSSTSSQIAEMIIKLEELINNQYKPDLIIAVGDVNSTLAAAITANKMNIKLAHLESGLRSFDTTMPEEHNRVVTDALSNMFFVTEPSGINNLKNNNVNSENVLYSGNTMIDTLIAYSKEIDKSTILKNLNINTHQFVLITMHRPSNVDNKEGLLKLCQLLNTLTLKYKVVFPIHPRTLKALDDFDLKHYIENQYNLIIVEPLDYFSFQKLIKESKFIITDSGGIQEESTYLGVPCLTIRPNTERPITVTQGTNTLVHFDIEYINQYIVQIEKGLYKKGQILDKWDGNSTSRIIDFIDKNI